MDLSNFHLNKNIPTPLYYQLKQLLLEQITSHKIAVSEQIPNEAEFVETLGISRSTVRQAIGELVSEGYLYRVKAKGTFVSKPKVDEGFFQKLDTFNGEMKEKGLQPSTHVLDFRTVPGKTPVNGLLGLSPDRPLLYLCRLRYADGAPVVYVETYLPYDRFEGLTGLDFTSVSLYEELEAGYGVRIERAVRRIEAINASAQEAKLLEIRKGAALCLVKTLAYDRQDHPVEYSVARYSGELNQFSVELRRQD